MPTDWYAADFFRGEETVADPCPYYGALRSRCPVIREPNYGVVMITGYEEAVQVTQDAGRFSSCISVTGPFPGFPAPLEGDDVSELIEAHRHELPMSDQLPTMDAPAHTDNRALLMRLITPKRLKENEEAMWRLADDVLDRFLAAGTGEFISGFAQPFTMTVIADLLGVPEADRQEMAARIASPGATVGDTSEQMGHSPLEFLYQRFGEYIAARRAEPADDVMTQMAQATFPDGSQPSVADVTRLAANLFSAGQETTVRLLGSALKVIADQPDMQRLLREQHDRIPAFIEETLRLESPIKGDFRLSKVATAIGGVDIPAGTTVMVLNGAANRDPRRFTDPDTFDPARPNARQHIAFGRGPHACPGAPLARTEARVAIERLLERTEWISISEQAHGPVDARTFQYIPTYILRGLTHLVLDFRLPAQAAR